MYDIFCQGIRGKYPVFSMRYIDRARAHLVENKLLLLSGLLTTLLLVLQFHTFKPDPHLEHALDSTVIVETKNGHGTGFFINKDGCIMTAAHVILFNRNIDYPIAIKVRGHGYKIPVKIQSANEYLDMAILCSAIPSQSYLQISETENIRQGEDVYAIGHPMGRNWNVTNGIISRSGYRNHHMGNVWLPRFDLWFTAFISWGNSGGPLINSYGKVVGMVVEWDDPGVGKPNNTNVAIPGSDLKRFIRAAWGRE